MINLINFSYTPKGLPPILNSINADFLSGEKIGILSTTGTGKTTLARLLCRSETPTSGHIITHGTVSWPLGYSGFFHPELTGLENILVLSELYSEDSESIIEWAIQLGGLSATLDKKLKHFSPTERSMLGYSCSLAIPFDWYIADEKLTVGGRENLHNCEEAISIRLSTSGLVFISKNINQIKKHCSRYFILTHGSLIECPDADIAVKALEQAEKIRQYHVKH